MFFVWFFKLNKKKFGLFAFLKTIDQLFIRFIFLECKPNYKSIKCEYTNRIAGQFINLLT